MNAWHKNGFYPVIGLPRVRGFVNEKAGRTALLSGATWVGNFDERRRQRGVSAVTTTSVTTYGELWNMNQRPGRRLLRATTSSPGDRRRRREVVFVDGAVLHDQGDVPPVITEDRDVLQWIAVHEQDIGVGALPDHTERT